METNQKHVLAQHVIVLQSLFQGEVLEMLIYLVAWKELFVLFPQNAVYTKE